MDMTVQYSSARASAAGAVGWAAYVAHARHTRCTTPRARAPVSSAAAFGRLRPGRHLQFTKSYSQYISLYTGKQCACVLQGPELGNSELRPAGAASNARQQTATQALASDPNMWQGALKGI